MGRTVSTIVGLIAVAACGESTVDVRINIPTSACGESVVERTFALTVTCDDAMDAPIRISGNAQNNAVEAAVRSCGDSTLSLIIYDARSNGEIVTAMAGEQRVQLRNVPMTVDIPFAPMGILELAADYGTCTASLHADELEAVGPVVVGPDPLQLLVAPGQYEAECAFADGRMFEGYTSVPTCGRSAYVFENARAAPIANVISIVPTHLIINNGGGGSFTVKTDIVPKFGVGYGPSIPGTTVIAHDGSGHSAGGSWLNAGGVIAIMTYYNQAQPGDYPITIRANGAGTDALVTIVGDPPDTPPPQ